MKKYLLVVITFFIVILRSNAQVKLTETQKAVQKSILEVFDALSNRDTSKLKFNCTTDIMVLENGIVWNIDTLIKKICLNTATDFKRINTIDFIDTKINENVAWTTYNNQAEITKEGKHGFVKWLETAILVKEGKIWKIRVLHSTLIMRS